MPISINLSDILYVLTARERRAVVSALRDDNPRRVENIISTDEDVRVQMFHHHFPVLESNDVVAWNADDEVIARGPAYADVEAVLSSIEDGGDVSDRPAITATGD